jgi:hypothetical protein
MGLTGLGLTALIVQEYTSRSFANAMPGGTYYYVLTARNGPT